LSEPGTLHIQRPQDFGIGRDQIFVGGSWVDAASGDRREIFDPKDESIR
jgi:lactaldehyde dehydrogenase/glycolaldehyde dehydrogenase